MKTAFLFLLIPLISWPKPSWFGEDTKSPEGWTFYCESNAKKEDEALKLARAECSRKMCMLFGVEVKVSQVSEETLKDVATKTTVIESCPDVRIVGRAEKKKLVDCSDDVCESFVVQFYPMSEYEAEKKRLNNPKIVPALEKTIIVREGNETFKDPGKCKAELRQLLIYSDVTLEHLKKRKEILQSSEKECSGLDYRNTELQNELMGIIIQYAQKRGSFYASGVLQRMLTTPTILDKIKLVKSVEESQSPDKVIEIQRLLVKHYDSLFFRMDHGDSYMREIRSCAMQSKILRAWPEAFYDAVTVCAPNKVTKGEDCSSTSMIMIRAMYAGCVCRNGAPERESPCTQFLTQHMNDECPTQMTEECFRKMSVSVAERMKVKILPIYK